MGNRPDVSARARNAVLVADSHFDSGPNGTPLVVELGGAPELGTNARRHYAQAEEWRAAEDRLHQVTTASQSVLYTMRFEDGAWHLDWFSDNIALLLGYQPEEVFRPGWWAEGIHPEDRRWAFGIVPRLLAGSHQAAEYRFRRWDGAYLWLRDELRLLRDSKGLPVRIVGSWADISPRYEAERRREAAERALEESEERLRLALRAAQMANWEWVIPNAKLNASPALETMHGLPEGSFSGSFEDFLAIVHPDDRALVAEQAEQLMRGERVSELEYRVALPDGEVRWIYTRGRLFFDASGAPERVLGVALDVTARKLAEEELQRARAAAERCSQAKSEFLANMSHELRTPLTSVLGFAEILAGEDAGALNERQTQYAAHILSSGRHLLTLVNGILDLAKIEAGRTELEPALLDLPALLHDTVEVMAVNAARKGVALELDVQTPIPLLEADARKLRQVVLNLLSNALKFTPAGGRVWLETGWLPAGQEVPRAAAAPPPAEAHHGRDRERVWLAVCDNGLGIDPAHQALLFHPFEQVDNTHGQQHPGTGLGLVLSRRLVELHCGRIWLESEGAGKGSRVTVVLPLDNLPEHAREEKHAAS